MKTLKQTNNNDLLLLYRGLRTHILAHIIID